MSERPIAVGDLVMVVRSCCNHRLGATFVVEEITTPAIKGYTSALCEVCHRKVALRNATVILEDQNIPWPKQWLKRIPPLDELEGERTEEKLKEVA